MFYQQFKGVCAECGKEIFLDNPKQMGFCNKMCETNYKWRKSSFGSTQKKHTWDREKIKKQK